MDSRPALTAADSRRRLRGWGERTRTRKCRFFEIPIRFADRNMEYRAGVSGNARLVAFDVRRLDDGGPQRDLRPHDDHHFFGGRTRGLDAKHLAERRSRSRLMSIRPS